MSRTRSSVLASAVPASSVFASAAIAALTLASAAGCSSSAPAAGPSPLVSGTSASSPGPAGPTAAGCDTSAWRTAPVSVQHSVPVPPVPVVAAVRVAKHPECGYDRLVVDINGKVPSYDVRYVGRVVADASGKTITMRGRRYLLITLKPAQGHTAAGAPTVARQVQLPGYPALQSWVLSGDAEGVVRIAVGLPGKVSIRTGELAGRIYIDVKEL
jgi:hypothetical protein